MPSRSKAITDDLLMTLIKQYLPKVQLVYLFGSRASKQDQVDSDWDFAVLNVSTIGDQERWDIAQELADKLNADVDLVDLLSASTVLKMQVVNGGRLLYGETGVADVFETQTYSMYGRLQESRSDIISHFAERIKNG